MVAAAIWPAVGASTTVAASPGISRLGWPQMVRQVMAPMAMQSCRPTTETSEYWPTSPAW